MGLLFFSSLIFFLAGFNRWIGIKNKNEKNIMRLKVRMKTYLTILLGERGGGVVEVGSSVTTTTTKKKSTLARKHDRLSVYK